MRLLTDYAKSFIGVPYIWGGQSPEGFDCSGYIQFVLASIGMDPPGDQTAQSLHDDLLHSSARVIFIPEAGALCFYGKSLSKITHVQLCLNPYQIIEAGGGGSTTTTVEEAKKIGACVRIKLQNSRKDLVSIIMPKYPEWVKNG